jgi:ABC-type lipoprotein export system ATPase subunit
VVADAVDGTGPDLVVLEGIERRFGSSPPVVALRGVNLRVRAGEWLGVVGPSGSGKSTLLHIVGCLDRPDEGSYRFAGIDVAALSDNERAGLRARRLGFVFQSFHLLAHRSVAENVMLAEIYRGGRRDGRRDRALAALKAVGLSHRASHRPTQLSGGERQRAAIARALVNEPALVLADEPTGALDSAGGGEVLELFRRLHTGGQTIVLVTHSPDVAAAATRRVRMRDGLIEDDGRSLPPAPAPSADGSRPAEVV